METYAKRFVAMIKTAKTDKELYAIVDKVYSDGFEDGCNEGGETEPKEEVRKNLEELVKDKDKTEITVHEREYWILHICKNNVPVPLFHSKNSREIKKEILSNEY